MALFDVPKSIPNRDDASTILDDKNMIEASREFDLWRRAKRIHACARILHIYLVATILLIIFMRNIPWLVGTAASIASLVTCLIIGGIARKAGDDLPHVEHRREEIRRLAATSYAVSGYSWLICAISAGTMIAFIL